MKTSFTNTTKTVLASALLSLSILSLSGCGSDTSPSKSGQSHEQSFPTPNLPGSVVSSNQASDEGSLSEKVMIELKKLRQKKGFENDTIGYNSSLSMALNEYILSYNDTLDLSLLSDLFLTNRFFDVDESGKKIIKQVFTDSLKHQKIKRTGTVLNVVIAVGDEDEEGYIAESVKNHFYSFPLSKDASCGFNIYSLTPYKTEETKTTKNKAISIICGSFKNI